MIWDALIACYLFLAGMGAGAFALGAIAGWGKEPALTMKKIGFIVGPVAVAVGTLLLVVDAHAGLQNPLRFFYLITNLNSVMAWGVIILSVFLVVAVIDLALLLVKKETPKWLDGIGVALALCVAAYTGVLLGDAGAAFPLWNMAVLPVLFVVSAASTGIAVVALATHLLAPAEVGRVALLKRAGLVLPLVEGALVIVLLAVTAGASGSAAAAGQASVAALVSGPYAVAFWLGFVVLGLALPFALELVRARKGVAAPERSVGADVAHDGSGKTLALVGDAGVLVGGFMLRYLVVMAALPVAFM